jgi:SAM-dependent methyltransferase
MASPGQAPDPSLAGLDPDRPNAARMYDYFLGGSHNFAADRDAAEQAARAMPELPLIMRTGRAFLRRAVRYLLAAGIDQFLDLGAGIPTVGAVHEIAQEANPAARVVYVDLDVVVIAHARAILAGNPGATAIHADLRDPDRILGDPRLRGLLDLDRPLAVLMVAVLHFVPDADEPAGVVARYRAALAPGSYFVLGHAARDDAPPGQETARQVYDRTGTSVTPRSRAQVAGLLAGLDLVEPGLVHTPLWRPESPTDPVGLERLAGYAAVGRMPVAG